MKQKILFIQSIDELSEEQLLFLTKDQIGGRIENGNLQEMKQTKALIAANRKNGAFIHFYKSKEGAIESEIQDIRHVELIDKQGDFGIIRLDKKAYFKQFIDVSRNYLNMHVNDIAKGKPYGDVKHKKKQDIFKIQQFLRMTRTQSGPIFIVNGEKVHSIVDLMKMDLGETFVLNLTFTGYTQEFEMKK